MMAPRSASFKLLYGFSKISSYNLGYEPVFFKLLLYRFGGNSNESFLKEARLVFCGIIERLNE